ncbi:hypothetical protein [Georgenia sp. SYP-B2076]|uniref:hypothetical protein n=1 Tax=Georgenia sp. SYP-B2076 TaxID=2495881 RepID=UPI000F8E1D26|nr:hypothetical protein [Georgenia sp. SYP-B2076]
MRAHLLAVVVGLVLTPVGLLALLHGAAQTVAALGDGAGPEPLLGLAWALLGAALLGAVAAVAAVGSSLALVVGGVVWGVLPGLLGGSVARLLLERAVAGSGVGVADAVAFPALGGTLLAAGVVLTGAGLAAHLARRAGRGQERAEAELAAADRDDDSRAGTAAPVPPRSRVRAHVLGTVVAVVLTPLALILLGSAANRLMLGFMVLRDDSEPWQQAPLLGACVLLLVVMVLGRWSSLGPQLAGWLLCLLPGVAVALSGAVPSLRGPLETVLGSPAGSALILGGALVVLGVVMVVGGAAAHFARRAGRRFERVDLALASR